MIRRIPLPHYNKLGGSQICSISVSYALVIRSKSSDLGECRLKRGRMESRFAEKMIRFDRMSDAGIISRERLPLLDVRFRSREPEMVIDA
jgi:hypothetical protein